MIIASCLKFYQTVTCKPNTIAITLLKQCHVESIEGWKNLQHLANFGVQHRGCKDLCLILGTTIQERKLYSTLDVHKTT